MRRRSCFSHSIGLLCSLRRKRPTEESPRMAEPSYPDYWAGSRDSCQDITSPIFRRKEVTMIPRYRTALKRTDLSRPAKCALRDGLIGVETSVLDYGCGHGTDVDLLASQGITCAGWDPVFFPDGPAQEAD